MTELAASYARVNGPGYEPEDLRDLSRDNGINASLAVVAASAEPDVAALWARLGASERLRAATLEWLRGRRSADQSMLTLPMIRAQLADVAADQLEIELAISSLPAHGGSALIGLHRRITEVDRRLTKLYGAQSFLASGIGLEVLASERLARSVSRTPTPVRRRWSASTEHPLPQVQRAAASWGRELRELGEAIDQDPDDPIALRRIAESGAGQWLRTAGISGEHGGTVRHLDGRDLDGRSALERVVVLLELGRGDVGAMLAAPGPSMSGVLVDLMGSPEQQSRYFHSFVQAPTWSCFALTEPDHGSDAASMETTITQDGDRLTLNGRKKFVGNAARATTGVVFARHSPGPLGVGAYIVDTDRPQFRADPLPMAGLRAAQICDIHIRDLSVSPEDELAIHQRRSRRGLRGAIGVFDRLRPGVAALAAGAAATALDAFDQAWPNPPAAITERVDEHRRALDIVRELIIRSAILVDRNGDGALGSIAKVRACRLAETITLDIAELLGPAHLEDELLDRSLRAARGLEFMEGTTNIQLLNAFRAVDADRLSVRLPPG